MIICDGPTPRHRSLSSRSALERWAIHYKPLSRWFTHYMLFPLPRLSWPDGTAVHCDLPLMRWPSCLQLSHLQFHTFRTL